MKDNTEYLKEQGFKQASEQIEIILKFMLHKQSKDELFVVRNYSVEEIEEILNQKNELLAASRCLEIKYHTLILGDPNNPKERRIFILQSNESGRGWDVWEKQETEMLPFLHPNPPISDFHFFENTLHRINQQKKDKREIML